MTALTARPAAVPGPGRLPRFGMARAAWHVHRRELLSVFAELAAVVLALLISGLIIHAEPAGHRPQLQGLISGADEGARLTQATSWLLQLLFPFGLYPPVFGAAVRGVVTIIATTTAISVILAYIHAGLRYSVYLPQVHGLWRSMPRGSLRSNYYYTWLNGHPVSDAAVSRLQHLPGGRNLPPGWLAGHHVLTWYIYQPPSRFWPFQLIETGGLLALAVLFGALAVWRVRRHSVWPRAKDIT